MEGLEEMFRLAAKKRLALPKPLYYRAHLMIVNGILPLAFQLTTKQIDILVAFMCLEGDISRHRFGTTGRRIVMEQLNLEPSALSNQLGKLKKKTALTESEVRYEYNIVPLLMPNPQTQYYFFKLENQGGNYVNENQESSVQQEEQSTESSD